MIPVPLIVVLCTTGGTVLGTLIRQPEINKLKKQIKELQKDNSRVKQLMRQQQENLEKMLVEYSSIRFYHVLTKRKIKQSIRGEIVIGYELKEYVDLLKRSINEKGVHNFSEREKEFFELSMQLIEGENMNISQEKFMSDYVIKKYKKEILRRKDANILVYVKQIA